MRNEAGNAYACLESLTALKYPALEVLIVNDGSTDNTESVVKYFISGYRGDKTLRYLLSPPKPPDWIGKSFAADFGIKKSRGMILLICDADVRHAPHTLQESVSFLQARNAVYLCRMPHLRLRRLNEYPYLFLLDLLTYSSLIARLLGSRQAFATGTYLLFTRSFYERTGGWSENRTFPEPLALLRCGRRNGEPFTLMSERPGVSARMSSGGYDTARNIIRNINFALLPPLPTLIVCLFLTIFASLGSVALTERSAGAAVLMLVITLLYATHVRIRTYSWRVTIGSAVLLPLMPLYVLILTCAAALRQIFNIPVTWKERSVFTR